MKVFIMHKFKTYDSTPENYAWADAFRTKAAALRAVRAEIASDIDADFETSDEERPENVDEIIKKAVEGAFAAGGRDGFHNAILYYGDFTAYYDITVTNV